VPKAKATPTHAEQDRKDGLPPVYVASENETPRSIANKFKVDAKALVELNKRFLKGLTQQVRSRRRTRG
jgi:hypothetical protein